MSASRTLVAVVVGLGVASAGYAGQEQVYRPGGGVTAPVIEKELRPKYTPAALTARVQGEVKLECVVRADGTVEDIRVVEPLHPDLDAAAVAALGEWRFKPGTKDGKPVAVRVEVEMTFTLREPEVSRGPGVGSAAVYKKSDGVVMPAIVKEAKPSYTAQAMRDRAQGSVKLDCVILPDGTVGDVQVSQRLHPELDAEAVRVLKQWTFKPGTKGGVAVPVQVEVEMTFTLRSKR